MNTGVRSNRDEDIMNNVYDLYGCHDEWTMGFNGTNSRMLVTWVFTHNGNTPDGHENTQSTRATLYIE